MKNKNQQEKRRQAKIQRNKQNRNTYKATPPGKPLVLPKVQLPIDLNLWLACAINYVASDYETGTWSPVWDEHGVAPFPERVKLFEAVHEKYWDTEAQAFTGRLGSVLAGWTMLAERTVLGLQIGYLHWMQQHNPDKEAIVSLLTPHDAGVWEFFHTEIRQKLLASATPGENA